MSTGQGTVIVQQKRENTSGFVSGAENGIYKSGNNVRLGTNPLIENTAIDVDEFNFELFNVLFGFIQRLDLSNIAAPIGVYGMGDGSGTDEDAKSYIQFEKDYVGIITKLYQALNIVNSTGVFEIGDTLGAVNGSKIGIDDINEQIFLKEGSLAAAALNYVWSLQDAATGRGAWKPATGSGQIGGVCGIDPLIVAGTNSYINPDLIGKDLKHIIVNRNNEDSLDASGVGGDPADFTFNNLTGEILRFNPDGTDKDWVAGDKLVII